MNLFVIVLCLAAGGLIGFMGGVLGIGGGLIAIPALVLLMDMPQQLAQGTALIMVLPTIMMAVRKYNQQVRIDKRVAAAGAAGAVVFTWFGARLALGIDSSSLRLSFAVFLFFIALFYVWQTWRASRSTAARDAGKGARKDRNKNAKGGFAADRRACLHAAPRQRAGHAVRHARWILRRRRRGAGRAIITSVFRLPQTTAQALALSMVIPGSTIALITYTWAGQANWMVGAPLAVGSLAFVPVGVRLAYRLPERRLRACFALMLFATVALLAFEA